MLTDLSGIIQYGVLGIVVALLIPFARMAYKRETDRADRLESEVLRLNQLLQDRVIPALLAATRAVEQSQELLFHSRRQPPP